MKGIVLALIYVFLSQFNGYGQNYDKGISDDIYNLIRSKFISKWHYFRMKKNPLLSYEETHNEWGEWKYPYLVPNLIPKKFFDDNYSPVIKVRRWYPTFQKYNSDNKSIIINDTNFYIVEKSNGITGIKWDYFSDLTKLIPLDTMHVYVYDSLFPYDNRFLVYHTRDNKILFCSGNVQWDHPMNHSELNWLTRIDRIGYIRGVQFDVNFVQKIEREPLEEIRRLRPEYSNYVYAKGRTRYAFNKGRVLIGAPEGKEIDLIEYIFYSNDPDKTNDSDKNNMYEMRYVVPSEIKTISERRMERRKLSPEEWAVIKESILYEFYDYWETYFDIDAIQIGEDED
jgi:hypothetical protein